MMKGKALEKQGGIQEFPPRADRGIPGCGHMNGLGFWGIAQGVVVSIRAQIRAGPRARRIDAQ